MKFSWTVIAALAIAPIASAQQPQSGPPELKAPTVSEPPPAPQLPPGVLEGRNLPSQPAQSAPSRAKGANAALDKLAVRNSTSTAAWVSVYDGDMPTGGACVSARDETVLDVPRGARLRAQATRDAACEQPGDTCNASLDLAPGTKGVELRAAGNGCTLQPANGGLLQRRPPSNQLKVINTSPNLWLWVTRYDWGKEPLFGAPRRNIVQTTCLGPGQSVDYTITRNTYYTGGARKFESAIRGEFVQGNCRHPRPCDTGMVTMEWWSADKTWYIHYDPQGRIRTRFPLVGMNRCGGTWTPNA